MTDNNEMNGRHTPFILRVDAEDDNVRNIGTLVSRNSTVELIKRILAEVYANTDRARLPIIFDSSDEPFCVYRVSSGKGSLFSAHEIARRCNKVERPRAVCFARYMTRLESPYIPEKDLKKATDNGKRLSLKGHVPISLSDAHPELYKEELRGEKPYSQ